MNHTAAPAATVPLVDAARLLVELDRLGVHVRIKGDRLSLRPASRIPPELLGAVRPCKAQLMALLAEPRRRWRGQAKVMVTQAAEPNRHSDLLMVFDEREAIAAVDGGLDDGAAGRLAYEQTRSELGHDPMS
jgi:hypothetical protein